jgi:hypothetical protein
LAARSAVAGLLFLILGGISDFSMNPLSAVDAMSAEGSAVSNASSHCHLAAGRSSLPSFVEQGDLIDVSAWYDIDCGVEAAPIDLVLVLDVQPLLGDAPNAAYRESLDASLEAALDRLPWGRGARMALIRAGTGGHSLDLALTADARAVSAALDAALALTTTESLDLAGDLGPALDAATALLDASASTGGADNRSILLLDAGMPLATGDQGVLNPPAPACQRATEAGHQLAVTSLPAAGRRLSINCSSPGLYEDVGGDEQRPLDLAMDQMLRVLVHPGSVVRLDYSDFLKSSFEFVPESGRPRDPDFIALAEHVWQDEVHEQRTLFRLDYQIRVRQGFGEIISPLSLEAKVALEHADGSVEEHSLPNPPLCIHWPGLEDFCQRWLRSEAVGRSYLPSLSLP